MKFVTGVLVLTLIPAAAASAKPKHWHDDDKHWNKHHADDRESSCYFRPGDVQIVREYYEPRDRSLPPGLAKKYYRTGQLPPGWQKKMKR